MLCRNDTKPTFYSGIVRRDAEKKLFRTSISFTPRTLFSNKCIISYITRLTEESDGKKYNASSIVRRMIYFYFKFSA